MTKTAVIFFMYNNISHSTLYAIIICSAAFFADFEYQLF